MGLVHGKPKQPVRCTEPTPVPPNTPPKAKSVLGATS